MLMALTGTPGTGKTAAAEALRGRGLEVRSLRDIAHENGFVGGRDEEDGSDIIDVERMREFVKHWEGGDRIIEGHLSHWLETDVNIVLRCDPEVLRKRLEARDYTEKKVLENVRAEVIDVVFAEAMENNPKTYQLDTTSMEPGETASRITAILEEEDAGDGVSWLEKYDYLLYD